MKNKLFLVVLIFIFSGCISTSNITSLGNGTYHITASDKGGVFSEDGQVVGILMSKAQAYCKNKNKDAKTVKLDRSDEGPMKFESSDLLFECK